MPALLRRQGNKAKLLPKLIALFPTDILCFIDMFMGSGSVTMAMASKVRHVIANDLDSDIFNFYMIIEHRKEELYNLIQRTPVSQRLFNYWSKHQETDPLYQAMRFIYLSANGIYGSEGTINIGRYNGKQLMLEAVSNFLMPNNIMFMNKDFRKVLDAVHLRNPIADRKTTFIYADPPYIGTSTSYVKFTPADTEDLINILIGSGMRFGISEFSSEAINNLATKHNLITTEVVTRFSCSQPGAKRTEILLTNYQPLPTDLFA